MSNDEKNPIQQLKSKEYYNIIRGESIRHTFMVQKSALESVSWTILSSIKNISELEATFSRELKKHSPLHLLVDETYGQIVNEHNIPKDTNVPELFRIFENHKLWEEKYLAAQVRHKYFLIR